MKKSIVFSSSTGNTQKLAEAIKDIIGDVDYIGKPAEEAANADVIFVGSWTMAFTCTADIKKFLESLNGKKVFFFMTSGYGSSEEYLKPIITSMKANLNDSNEVIGEFICQGKVSAAKQEAIKKMDMEKFESMKAELEISQSHPDENDIAKLIEVIKSLEI